MSGSNPYVPAIAPDSLYITPGYAVQQQKPLTRTHCTGIIATLFLAASVFVLGLSAEISFQKAVKDRPCEVTIDKHFKGCVLKDCSDYGTPAGLIGASLMLTLVLSIVASVYGACPCCCYRSYYAKNVHFALSILFLVLLWLAFVVTLVFGFFDLVQLAARSSDKRCLKLNKGQLVSVAVLGTTVGLFGAAHIATSSAARLVGRRDANLPMGVPIQPPI